MDCSHCGLKSPMFNHLTAKELELVSNNKFEVKFRKGEIVRKQGTFLSHVISINTGLVKLYIEGYQGKNLILRIIKSQNFIGGPGMYYDQRHHYSVIALVETSACFIDINVFKQIIHTNPDFAADFMKDISKNMLSSFDRLISLSQKQIPGRMADALIYLSQNIFESNIILPMITKNELSELTSMSKDSVVRILREFKNEGILKLHQGIEILKPDELTKISNVG
jgi:CRP/FNR family transcriptional regulator